jgi:phospholipid-translocating ATPase
MDKWDGNTTVPIDGKSVVFNSTIKGLMLRGCILKNTEYCLGIVINTGPQTKIMMNAKKSPTKVSNVQRMMNIMLYSVFGFQFLLISAFAVLSNFWFDENGDKHYYLGETMDPGIMTIFI